jgi:hypothetical protein
LTLTVRERDLSREDYIPRRAPLTRATHISLKPTAQ